MTGLDNFEKMSENLLVKVDGEKAVSVPQKKGEIAVNFIKINDKWKIDYSKMEESPQGKLQTLAMESAIPKITIYIKDLEQKVLKSDLHPKDFNKDLTAFIMKTIQEASMEVLKAQQKARLLAVRGRKNFSPLMSYLFILTCSGLIHHFLSLV